MRTKLGQRGGQRVAKGRQSEAKVRPKLGPYCTCKILKTVVLNNNGQRPNKILRTRKKGGQKKDNVRRKLGQSGGQMVGQVRTELGQS